MSAAYADMECEEMVAADVAIARSVPPIILQPTGLYKPHNLRSKPCGHQG
jgi:hypothetical protein